MASRFMFTLLAAAGCILLLPVVAVVQATMDGKVFNHYHQPVGWFTWMEKTEGDLQLKAWLNFINPNSEYKNEIYPVEMARQGAHIVRLSVPEFHLELYLNGTLHGLVDKSAASIGSYMLDSYSTVRVSFATNIARESTPQEGIYPQRYPLPSYEVDRTKLSEGPILHIEVPLILQPASTEATNEGILPTLRPSGTLTRGVEREDIGTYKWHSATHVQVQMKRNGDAGHDQQQTGYSATLEVDGSGTLEEPWKVKIKLFLKAKELPHH